jgi:hypothetical protein
MEQQTQLRDRAETRSAWSLDNPLRATLSLTEARRTASTPVLSCEAPFQAWATTCGYALDTVPNGAPAGQERYRDDQTHHAWLGWLAASRRTGQ